MQKTIAKILFGSRLYGTSTPESDTDYKAIYLPSIEDCILQKVKKSINEDTNKTSERNTKEDTDFETWSLQYFLKMGFAGETAILDMIHAPDSSIIISSPEWEFIRKNRARFYSKNARSYIGYVRKQASKYGVKGSRLEEAEKVLTFLQSKEPYVKLAEIWNELPTGEHIKKYDNPSIQAADKRIYDVCSIKMMATQKVSYIEGLVNFVQRYGERAKLAKENKGVDWRAVSHAYRASFQLKEIYETGDLIYPLKDAEFLRDLKLGKYHYKDDDIGEKLDELVSEIEELANKSHLPQGVEKDFWNTWLTQLYVPLKKKKWYIF
ncbi:nucleotidyltransferase domain-containing protein [Candidatus Pacearchaeota archaeon]|nr:nucleotidyltransferase domain-containing protein [Candidatus Pacearchaeota archaeon]